MRFSRFFHASDYADEAPSFVLLFYVFTWALCLETGFMIGVALS